MKFLFFRKFTNHIMKCGNKALARELVEKVSWRRRREGGEGKIYIDLHVEILTTDH